MGNPKAWYTPVAGGTVQEIDFSDGAWVSQWQDNPRRDAGDAEAISGRTSHTARGTGIEAAISCQRFTDRGIAHKLMSLQHHLEIGGLFGFANDSDKAFAAYCTPVPSRGDTTITTGLPSWHNTGATLAAGDWMCIESSLPVGAREWVQISTFTVAGPGVTITLVDPVVYDHAGTALVRHEHYHPVLRWPVAGRRTLVTSDRQMVWSFAGTFRQDRDAVINDIGQGAGMVDAGPGMPPPRRAEDASGQGNLDPNQRPI